MLDSQSVYVFDTNVLIDLYIGGLLEVTLGLPARMVAPDVIIAELEEPSGETLIGYGLQSVTLSGDQVQEIVALRSQYPRPSANDMAALVLARSLGAALLTGDLALRRAAEQEGVPMHGTLWVLDELLESEVIPPAQAVPALEEMLAQGRRLPRDECEARLRRWRGMINGSDV